MIKVKGRLHENTPCRELLEAYVKCMQDKGFVGKLLNSCGNEERELHKCSLNEYERKRLMNTPEGRKQLQELEKKKKNESENRR